MDSKYHQRESIRVGPSWVSTFIVSNRLTVRLNDEMTHFQNELAQVLKGLQAAANHCARAFTTPKVKVDYRVAFSAGAPLPWRLLEIHRTVKQSDERGALRRMHCFSTPERLDRSIQERVTWKARDQELVASYLVQVRASPDGPASGEKHTATGDSSRRSVDLRGLTPARLELRAQMCVTKPGRVVDLLHGRFH